MSGALGHCDQDAVVQSLHSMLSSLIIASKDSIEAGEGGTKSGSELDSQYAQR